jgi:hypothetical protein
MKQLTIWLNCTLLSRYGSMEQPVKPNAVNYKNQPGRIENYTPGKSSISDKEAKQVNASIFNFRLQSIEFFFLLQQHQQQ